MLNHNLHRMKVEPSPICELCLIEEETVIHFPCSCPKLPRHRIHYCGSNFLMKDVIRDLKVQDVLCYINMTRCFEFLDV